MHPPTRKSAQLWVTPMTTVMAQPVCFALSPSHTLSLTVHRLEASRPGVAMNAPRTRVYLMFGVSACLPARLSPLYSTFVLVIEILWKDVPGLGI